MVLGPSKRCRRRSQTWEYEVTHMVTLLSSYATGNASSFWEGRPLYDPHQFGDDAGARESGKCRPPLVLMRCGAVSASGSGREVVTKGSGRDQRSNTEGSRSFCATHAHCALRSQCRTRSPLQSADVRQCMCCYQCYQCRHHDGHEQWV